MVNVNLKWWAWVLLLFLLMMVFEGPRIVSSAGGSVAHAAYKTAGDMDKGLHGMETCGSACHH